jgi:NAD(P)-dependent dehydrogenase (short-subunit alcohol dehydrogenase family)
VSVLLPSIILTRSSAGNHGALAFTAQRERGGSAQPRREPGGTEGRIQVERMGNPAEVGAPAAFLASSDSSFMPASEVAVDGGLAQL